ncbi:hypothetical protein GCM10022225_43500 [Plantactinospora mayteni]|uniref:Lipoprotein LpqB beta-propeller domain-containing protein n=1 Tax=Plantactinospora mayteni TaxID=566021 RepID=A0ABQ4ES65_9ACTN|nr:LpqB family beta-propeller domain-containing protein [Plantactinospora mayteni]GIG97440.1 hypothetical protein Pma05_40130 [Plantactinospora mayteni]
MSRRGIALGAVAVLLSGLAACGIPGESDVRIDGRGPVADTGPADRPGAQPPGRTVSGSEPKTFARNFLTAAAGEAGEAYKRVNEYIEPGARFNPKQDDKGDINVVRVDADSGIEITEDNDGTSRVTVSVQQVGVLRANGSVGAPVQQEKEYSFVIGAAPTDPGMGSGLWVLDPPAVLLMTDDALRDYYEENAIYFWNANGTSLVPDLRYLPRTVPVQRHATEVLDWLIGGPSEWLTSAVALPEGTSPMDNRNVPAPKQAGRIEVNLAVKAGALESDHDLQKLFTQIVWSLRTNQLLDELELKIQNQSKMVEVADDYRRDHPLYQLNGAAARYGVFAGRIYPLTNPGEARPVPIPATENHDIVTAGLSRNGDEVAVALVTRDDESFRLRTGFGPGVANSLQTSQDRYDDMSRPVWLKDAGGGGPVGLVVAEQKLWTFTAGNPNLTEVSFSGAPRGVTAVAASMDGNRIAFVSGGRLYVAAVRPVDGGLNVESPRQLATSLGSLSAVDWFGENLLVVAGLDSTDAKAINRINVDGSLESQQVRFVSSAPVEALAADPTFLEVRPLPLTYETNDVAFVSDTSINRSQIAPGAGEPPASVNSATASFYLY